MAIRQQVAASGEVANGAALTYQPGSGVEALITTVALKLQSSATVDLYDGSDTFTVASGAALVDIGGQVSIPVSNTLYIQLKNSSGSARDFAVVGVEVI